jgi:hypothetical protein
VAPSNNCRLRARVVSAKSRRFRPEILRASAAATVEIIASTYFNACCRPPSSTDVSSFSTIAASSRSTATFASASSFAKSVGLICATTCSRETAAPSRSSIGWIRPAKGMVISCTSGSRVFPCSSTNSRIGPLCTGAPCTERAGWQPTATITRAPSNTTDTTDRCKTDMTLTPELSNHRRDQSATHSTARSRARRG